MKIGFFDSGLGGLLVLKAVARALPLYDYEFFGDTAHLPYGDKTEEEICEHTKKGVCFLFERDCALVVIACNTASAQTLRFLQDTFLKEEYGDRKLLGVIIPMVEEAIERNVENAILIGTKRTVESGKYEREFQKFNKRPSLISVATPNLVPLIEEGNIEEASKLAIEYIAQHATKSTDCVILGCTHYALLKEKISDHFGKKILVLSPTDVIPKKLEAYLHKHSEIEALLSKQGKRTINLSKHTKKYDKVMQEILNGIFI